MNNGPESWISHLPGWTTSVAARISWVFFMCILLIALLSPLIANEKPYYCKLDGITYFPLFSGINESTLSIRHPTHSPVNWYTTQFETIWYAPVPYSHHTIDSKAGSHLSPLSEQRGSFRLRHWLGTDLSGRDVLAGMIRGCRVSLLIGLGAMLIALLIGVPLGSLAAYFDNRHLKASYIQIIAGVIIFLLIIYTIVSGYVSSRWTWALVLSLTGVIILLLLSMLHFKKHTLPLDQAVMSVISIIDGFPALFIVLIVLFLIPVKGWAVVMGVIALLRWPVMARYMRAEVYKMKEHNYIKAAQGLNFSHGHILLHHIIPYAFRPVMISFIFGVSGAILAESALSFLGIGLPPEELNWGRLLSQSRNHFDAWWLVVFPGAAIFFTLLSLYTIGNAAQREMKGRET